MRWQYLAVAPHFQGLYSSLELCCEGPWFTSMLQEDGYDKGVHQSYLETVVQSEFRMIGPTYSVVANTRASSVGPCGCMCLTSPLSTTDISYILCMQMQGLARTWMIYFIWCQKQRLPFYFQHLMHSYCYKLTISKCSSNSSSSTFVASFFTFSFTFLPSFAASQAQPVQQIFNLIPSKSVVYTANKVKFLWKN